MRKDVYIVVVGNPEGKSHLEDPGVDGRIFKTDLQEVGCGVRTGSSWLRIGTGGGHL